MTKHFDSDYDLDGKNIKRLDKKKHHSKNYNEDVLESRGNRVNFKNYLRQIKEQEAQDLAEEEWAVIRVTMLEDGDVDRQQVSVFLTEDEAEAEAESLQDQDGDENVLYKVELLC